MLLGKFKEQTLTKSFRKRLQKYPDTRTPTSHIIESVAIITTDEMFRELAIENVLKTTLKTVRNVQLYAFRKYKKSNEVSYTHFSEKDFGRKGKVVAPSFESFLESPFDLLIGYFHQKNVFMESAVLDSHATFKIGFSNVNNKLYDLVVDEASENIQGFMDLSKKYLEVLGKI